jgi:hypothetical protein
VRGLSTDGAKIGGSASIKEIVKKDTVGHQNRIQKRSVGVGIEV